MVPVVPVVVVVSCPVLSSSGAWEPGSLGGAFTALSRGDPFRESITRPRKAQEGPKNPYIYIGIFPDLSRSPRPTRSRLKPFPPKIKVSSRTISLIRPSGVG